MLSILIISYIKKSFALFLFFNYLTDYMQIYVYCYLQPRGQKEVMIGRSMRLRKNNKSNITHKLINTYFISKRFIFSTGVSNSKVSTPLVMSRLLVMAVLVCSVVKCRRPTCAEPAVTLISPDTFTAALNSKMTQVYTITSYTWKN